MATMTIRNIDPAIKEKLRLRAARHGQSMEAEVRAILQSSLGRSDHQETLTSIMGELFGAENGVELDLPRREPGREPPVFE